ncbi:MAG: D-alanyl-D-alanine carboxypeptidase family protein [Angelakisella sp.]
MKKISLLLSIAIIFSTCLGTATAWAVQVQELPFDVRAKAVYMENLETGQVMVSQNIDTPLPPASLTKIMTAILTLEKVKNPDTETHTLRPNINEMIVGTGAKTGGYYPRDEATIRDILYHAMVFSGAEGALMLADYVSGGSIKLFVQMMNDRARELGCTNTNFTDPHGLDEEQYTTAHDMAILAKHAMSLPGFAEMVSTYSYEEHVINKGTSFPITNTNLMLSPRSEYYYAPVVGIKTGTITNDRCLVTQAKRNGYTYLVVLLGVPIREADGTPTTPGNLSFSETKKLYEWAFENFGVRTAVERGEELVEIPVKYSFDADFVRLATAEQFTALMHKNIQPSSILYEPDIPDHLEAPVTKGQTVGKLRLMYMEEELGSVPLVASADIKRSQLLWAVGWAQNEIHTFRAKFIILVTVGLLTLYLVLILRARNIKKRSGKYSSYRSGSEGGYHL